MNLPLNETHSIHDSTKVQGYMDCARKYFFEYVVGWKPDKPNIHLKFGECWHLVQEHILMTEYSAVGAIEAYALFTERYRQYFPSEETDVDRAPKVPGNVFQSIPKYLAFAGAEGDVFEVLYTEIGGSVAISPSRRIHFKMDSILRNKSTGLIQSLEHKTASAMSKQNKDKWKLMFQTGTYNHVLYCVYKPEEIFGVVINLAVFTKGKGVEYARIPVRRTIEMLEVWLWQANEWIDEIERDYDRLLASVEEDTVMRCFKRNEGNCTAYTGCPYMDFCVSWSNPLQHIHEVPEGFRQEYWNPTLIEVKHTMNL